MALTATQIVDELTAAQESIGEDLITTEQMADVLGLGLAATRRRMKILHRAGRLVPGKKTITNMAGQRHVVPAYRLVPE